MSTEQSPIPNLELKTLTESQEIHSRELFAHQFGIRYLYFQEFAESSSLFQANLVRDKGKYAIIFPYQGTDYMVPYELLDAAFADTFEKDLENPDQNPINFRQEFVIKRHTPDMPASLRDYLEKKVETMETVYWLKPIDGKRRAIWQTTYLDQFTGNPIAETWEGIIKEPGKFFPNRTSTT